MTEPISKNPTVFGHQWCECGDLVPSDLYFKCHGRCFNCWTAQEMPELDKAISDGKGRRVPFGRVVRISPPRNRDKPSGRDIQALGAEAHHKASAELRDLFPELFFILYSRQRVALGLGPPVVRDESRLLKALETYRHLLAYDADPDGGHG